MSCPDPRIPSHRAWRWLQLVLFSAFLASFGTSSVAQPYCNQAQAGPGFASNPGCEAVICGLDPYCCNTQWDGICAGAAVGQPACATCLDSYVPPVGCQNAIPFGTATPLGETLTTISTCSYLEEYSVINGILSGRNYEFTVSGPGGYITVRDGSVGGPILGAGATPLTVTTTSTNALYVHWNVDAACATETGICHTTTVQLLPPPACAPNGVLYPAAAVTPNANGTVTSINTCHFLNEYSQITGIVSGADYTFNSGTIGYITVRSGTPGGAVIGAGVPPLTVTAPDGNDIFPHWYVNAACATASGTCHAATVQRILVCTLPSATLAVVADCANNQFSIDVTVTSLGSATDVGISTNLLGVQHASVGLGTFSVGPFTSGASPIVTVIHNQDNSCNAGFPATNFTCPAIVNTFPYCENFELATNCIPGACNTVLACTATALNPVSWQQGSGDGGEWSVDEGGTSSGATGPVTGAGTGQLDYNPGTITGNYLYLESSVPCDQVSTPGAGAIALSPIFNVSGFTNPNVRATMAYHMLGATMGTMAIDIEDPALSNNWTTLWSQTGATGAAWFLTPTLDHAYSGTTVRYRVRGIAGSSFTSDMAFDYFCVSEGPLCTAPTANVTLDGAACPNFNLNVDVLTLGSAANVNISYTVNGGLPTSVGPFGTGVQVLGPFTNPDVVNVTIVHNGDAACNVPKGNFSGPSLCNDICSGAITVTCASSPVNGTTVGATTESVANCGAGNTTPALGVWYRYVGDNQQVTLNTCAAPGFDSRLTVYSGTCGSLTCVVGNDDDNTCVVSGLRSAVTFNAFAGTDYYIMVHSFGEATQAAFVMNMSCSPLCLPVPGNDLCANAAPIVPSSGCVTTAGTTSCADATLGNPTCISGFATAPDVYYSFVAGDATQIINFSNITAANLGFAIYTACGGAQLACNGAVVNGGDNVVAGLINGAPYIMRVFSLQGQQGDFDVCIKNPCLPPTANVTPTYFNCASATPGQTDVLVDVLTVGGDPTVDVVINGVTVASGVGVGTYGPYSYGSGVSVDVDIVTDDTFCDLSFGPFINPSSCIICDGPTLNQTFCYGGPFAAGSTSWLYEAGGVGTFELNMYGGSVESNTWDDLTIYDGPDNTFPILFANGGTTDFSVNPFTVTATGSSLFMTLSWDTAVDCAGGSFTPLLWDVYCVNCDFVAGNVSNTNVDCGTSSYSFDVNVTDLGDAPDVDVVIDYPVAGTVAHNDVGLGTYSITGIPVGTPVAVLLQHNGNLACNDDLGVVNPTSNCIVCDNSILNEGPFCYGPNANQNWSYTSDGLGTMILNFSSGTVESNTWDDLTIYDGPDNTFPILFANPNATISLAGVQVVASGNALFMTLTADASVQCTSNVGWDWNWTVQCVDCTQPDGTVTVIENCGGGDFTLQVDVTDASNAGSVNILTDYLGDVEPSGVGLGTYVLGPYPSGTAVAVTLEHPNNVFCTLALGSFQDCCNGTCAGASAAVVGINANGEYNCGVPSNLFPVIGLTPNDARWWNYTPGVTERITVSACAPVNSTNTDTYVTVSTGPCASLGLHGGNDDECGLASSYTFQGTPGVEYHIEWDDRWGDDSAHDWELAVTPCVSPANDLCSSENPAASPVSIGSPQTFTGTRDCADKDGITNALTFPTIAGWVWESFELTQCANVTIDYCGTPGGTGNGALNMYGDCGTLFINSQTFAFNCDGNTNATITFTDLSPGFYYYPVLWDPNNNAQGAYTINVTAFAPTNPCPTNLTCATAIPMVCNDILLGNTNNQFPTLPANACAYPNSPISGGSLWYSYTPVVDENVVVSTCGAGSLFDTRLDVYTGVCGTLSCYNLSDDKGGACTTRSQLEFYAQAGQTYYIAVHSATPFIDGQFEIAIGCGAACVPPANDVCGSAIGLTTYLTDNTTFFPGVPTAGDNGCAQNDPFTSCSQLANNQGMWYSFNSGTNTIHYLTLNTFDQNPGLTSTVMNYTLYSGGCNGMQGVAEGTCVLNGDGDYLLLPSLATGTNYLLYLYNQGDAGFEGTFEVLMEHPGMNDAGIDGVNEPVGLICTSTITPEVVLKNYGENPLTSVTITYDLDGITGPFVYNWTGNLPFLGTEVVSLPSFTAPYGSHTFNVSTSAPNSQVDDIPTNDADSELNVDVTGETMIVEITTDNDPSQLIWQIYDQGNQLVGVSPVYATPNVTVPTTLCLSTLNGTCFNFFLFDFLGDGLSQTGNGSGSWRLRTTGGATLLGDDFDGTVDGTFSPTVSPLSAWYTNGHPFCLPAGPTEPLPSECGIFTNNLQSKVYCKALPGVTNYQFQFLRPDEGYSRQISVPRNWVKFGEMQTFPLLPGEVYFCRVRADQAPFGNYSTDKYGTGCEMGIDPLLVPGCTGLVDDIGAPAHSCGVIKLFGGSDKIWAQPVQGATQYRFRFQNGLIDPDGPNLPGAPALGTRIITVASYALVLNWTNFTLVNGSTYDVTIEALVAGQWSGYCGPICQVEIDNTPGQSLRAMEASTSSDLQVWPNPVRDGQVNVLIGGLTDDTQRITLDVFDIYGKRVMAFDKENSGSVFNTILDMDGIAAGVYMVSVTVNDRVYQQRVSVL